MSSSIIKGEDMPDYEDISLEPVIDLLTKEIAAVVSIELFGSRAHRTGSIRSDVDIILHSKNRPSPVLLRKIEDSFPYLDIFHSYDGVNATSLWNGSSLVATDEGLSKMLNSKLLWTNETGFVDENRGLLIQSVSVNVNFIMSATPTYKPKQNLHRIFQEELDKTGVPDTTLNPSWNIASERLLDIIELSINNTTSQFNKRASNLTIDSYKIETEYDLQNIICATIKPWINDLEREPFIVSHAGAKKYADFSFSSGKFMIEAKHIKKTNKNEVIKSLKGISNIYSKNTLIECVAFFITVEEDVDIDVQVLLNDIIVCRSHKPVIVARIVQLRK